MQITVLGESPPWPDRGGACSGYLIREGDFTLLLDCGSGVFANLRRHVDYLWVDAVLLSHLHADHFLDLDPVQLRADLLGPPAAGRRGRLPGHRAPRPPGTARAARRGRAVRCGGRRARRPRS